MIFDDKCSSCFKFAKIINTLSRGHIKIAGHYNSEIAKEAKSIIFPSNYDPTKMFWLITSRGAYGARCGLVQVVKEVLLSIFKGSYINREHKLTKSNISCNCNSLFDTISRIINTLKNGKVFLFT
jgi:hypothetical protein